MLFEADFNINNKWIDQAIMLHRAVDASSNWAIWSWKCKVARIQCFNEQLFMTLSGLSDWSQWHLVPVMPNIWIILKIAALCLCRQRALIQAKKHDINVSPPTPTGTDGFWQLKWSQRASWNALMAGIWQGNSDIPQIQAAVSMPLFDILRQKGFVATFICVLSKPPNTCQLCICQLNGSHHQYQQWCELSCS